MSYPFEVIIAFPENPTGEISFMHVKHENGIFRLWLKLEKSVRQIVRKINAAGV